MGKLVAILLLFISISLDAQTVIVGKVIAHSGEPVNRVHIYCIESEKGTTTDQIFFDGLDRVKTALEAAEKAGKFDGLDTKGEALKPEENPGKFDGLNRETKALEAEEKVGTFDGLDTNGDALKAEEKAGIYDGFHTPKPVEKPADDIDGKA